MKFLIGAAAAATLLLATPALAQTQTDLPAACADMVAAAPTLPDGATAQPDAIRSTDEQFRAWHGTGSTKLGTCRTEIDATRARLTAMETAYNQAAQSLNATRDQWVVEVEEFNARSPRNRR